MKYIRLPFLFIFIFLTGCVQKAYVKTVMVTLTIPGKKNIEQVGIRGNGNPLNWEQDYTMTALIKDSVYTASFQTRTAFQYTEIKFTVNGEWELAEQPNRKVYYESNRDTVFIQAVFNQP